MIGPIFGLIALFAVLSGLVILATVITVTVGNWRRTQREISARRGQALERNQ